MRDLAKSAVSWAWSVSVFSAFQAGRLIADRGSSGLQAAASAFDAVTSATDEVLSDSAKKAMHAGLSAQQAFFGMIMPGGKPPAARDEVSSSEPLPIQNLAHPQTCH